MSVSEPEGPDEAGERGLEAVWGSLAWAGLACCWVLGPHMGQTLFPVKSAFWGVPAGPPHSLSFSSGLRGLPGTAGLGSKVRFVCGQWRALG